MVTTRPHAIARQHRGSAIVYMLIILSVVTTGLLMTIALSAGMQSQIAGMTLHRDQAFYAAEAGIERARYELQYDDWGTTRTYAPLGDVCGPGSYHVTVVAGGWNNPVVATSVGSVNSGSELARVTITADLAPAMVIPAIQLGGNFTGGGGDHITGDIQALGAISHAGNIAITKGNAWAAATIDSGIGFDTHYQAFPGSTSISAPPSVASIATTLQNAAGALQVADLANLDFTASSSRILYYKGDIASLDQPQVTGSGTLVVLGNMTVKDATTLGASNVNIVVTGNLATQAGPKFGLQGSLYVGGNFTSAAPLAVLGVIVGDQSMTTTGQGSDVFLSQPPPFDPRMVTGAGSRVLKNFTGPIFQ